MFLTNISYEMCTKNCYPHFTDEAMEERRDWLTCPRSQSPQVVELWLGPRLQSPKVRALSPQATLPLTLGKLFLSIFWLIHWTLTNLKTQSKSFYVCFKYMRITWRYCSLKNTEKEYREERVKGPFHHSYPCTYPCFRSVLVDKMAFHHGRIYLHMHIICISSIPLNLQSWTRTWLGNKNHDRFITLLFIDWLYDPQEARSPLRTSFLNF